MHWLTANSDPSRRTPGHRTLSILSAKHSFPSRLHQKPTAHKSVPKPTARAPFKATRGFPSYPQALWRVWRQPPSGPEAQPGKAVPPIPERGPLVPTVAQAFQPVHAGARQLKPQVNTGRDAPPTRRCCTFATQKGLGHG